MMMITIDHLAQATEHCKCNFKLYLMQEKTRTYVIPKKILLRALVTIIISVNMMLLCNFF